MQTIDAKRLKVFVTEIMTKGGFTEDEAKAIADSLILSELTGHGSHGIIRVKSYLSSLKKGELVSGATLRIIQETPNSLTVDAELGAGQVIMPALLKKLYAKLTTQAVVSAAVRHCGHVGRLGEWVEMSAQAGYSSLLLVNDNGTFFTVAPPGGKKSVTSTNPIAFAIPLPEGEVFLTDMSTSAIANGKVRLARINGESLPPNCLQDADGKATTDPEALFTDPPGSILPMGGPQGYKGFALSMFVDLLVAGLSGGQTPPATADTKSANNLTMVLWNPAFFAGLEHMQAQAKKYIDFVRASPPIDPSKPVRLPGDRMNITKHTREKTGIPLSEKLLKELQMLARELGITPLIF